MGGMELLLIVLLVGFGFFVLKALGSDLVPLLAAMPLANVCAIAEKKDAHGWILPTQPARRSAARASRTRTW